jgi:hypothetical protein
MEPGGIHHSGAPTQLSTTQEKDIEDSAVLSQVTNDGGDSTGNQIVVPDQFISKLEILSPEPIASKSIADETPENSGGMVSEGKTDASVSVSSDEKLAPSVVQNKEEDNRHEAMTAEREQHTSPNQQDVAVASVRPLVAAAATSSKKESDGCCSIM